jgi:transcriptional regulator with XRE-family HTH domain
MARESIGIRVANWRRLADMTQQQLADGIAQRLGRPYTGAYISMIENGKRAVVRRDMLIALAETLRVSITDLTGQPYPPRITADLGAYMLVPQIRAALDEPDDPIQPRTIDQLAEAADRAMAARMACDFRALSEQLPGLIAEARHLYHGGDERAGELLVRAAVTGALALKPAGWLDLAIRLSELADHVASRIDDPVGQAAARFTVAQCTLATGSRRRSLSVAETAATTVDRSPGEDARAWAGLLHLQAALTAASLHEADTAAGHLDEARSLARSVQGDPWRMEFNDTNVQTWGIGAALEIGEPERVPGLAHQVDPNGLRTPHRLARLHMDTARGYFASGRHDEAVRYFLAADEAAPGDLSQRPAAMELIGQLVRDARVRGGSDALRTLAVRVGIDPLAPDVRE